MMDRNFFEFWGRLFLSAAQEQKRMEDLESLFRQGMEGYESVMKVLRDAYSFDLPKPAVSENRILPDETVENFQASMRQLMSLWDMVPKSDYQMLQQKCEALEKINAEQVQQIGQLKALLGEKHETSFSATKEMQTLLNAQQAEFQSMMDGLGAFFLEKKKAPAKKK